MRSSALSISLADPVRDALTEEAVAMGRDLPDHVVHILEDHAIAQDLLDADAKEDIELARSLRDRAVEAAHRLARDGSFPSSITFDAIQSVCADPAWLTDYRKLVRDDPYKTGNPRKQTINQNLGYYIKKALGARSMTNAEGKPANVKVKGAIIQSYTPLQR